MHVSFACLRFLFLLSVCVWFLGSTMTRAFHAHEANPPFFWICLIRCEGGGFYHTCLCVWLCPVAQFWRRDFSSGRILLTRARPWAPIHPRGECSSSICPSSWMRCALVCCPRSVAWEEELAWSWISGEPCLLYMNCTHHFSWVVPAARINTRQKAPIANVIYGSFRLLAKLQDWYRVNSSNCSLLTRGKNRPLTNACITCHPLWLRVNLIKLIPPPGIVYCKRHFWEFCVGL